VREWLLACRAGSLSGMEKKFGIGNEMLVGQVANGNRRLSWYTKLTPVNTTVVSCIVGRRSELRGGGPLGQKSCTHQPPAQIKKNQPKSANNEENCIKKFAQRT
jgi:hypothetical protein